jgi:Carbohydrate family 9 binding domain-like
MFKLTVKQRLPLFFLSVMVVISSFSSCEDRKKTPSTVEKQSRKSVSESSAARHKIFCSKTAAAVKIDGKVEEWGNADTFRLDDPGESVDPNQVKIYTLWDENHLYIAYEVADRYLEGYQTERDHRALYKDDMIEVLLDPRKDATDLWLEDDIVYHINILGQVKDDRGTPEGISDAGWQSEALFDVTLQGSLNDSTDLDRGFCVELAVPWEEIGLEPLAGVTLGINFAVGDAEGADENLWDLCGASPFRQPSVYGRLELK